MDFITGLPESGGYDTLMVVVDRLSKMAHYIPTQTNVTAEEVARLFYNHVFCFHGLPDSIVTDRGTQFTSEFSRCLCKLLRIQQKLSTRFHPQTDGQTERINAILEQYLRGYCNYQQDNWAELLAMAEFAYNNTLSATTGITPFFARYGQNPRYEILANPALLMPTSTALKEYASKLALLDQHLKAEIFWLQDLHAEQADRHRIPPPAYKVRDEVWLLRRHLQTDTMKIHPVFHVCLLEPVAQDPLTGQIQPPPPPVVIDDELEWEVEEILDSRPENPRPASMPRFAGLLPAVD